MPIYYELESPWFFGDDMSHEQELEVICECGHPVRSHSWETDYKSGHVVWVGGCMAGQRTESGQVVLCSCSKFRRA